MSRTAHNSADDTSNDAADTDASEPHGPSHRLRLLATLIAAEIRRGGGNAPPAQAALPRPPGARLPCRPRNPIRCTARTA